MISEETISEFSDKSYEEIYSFLSTRKRKLRQYSALAPEDEIIHGTICQIFKYRSSYKKGTNPVGFVVNHFNWFITKMLTYNNRKKRNYANSLKSEEFGDQDTEKVRYRSNKRPIEDEIAKKMMVEEIMSRLSDRQIQILLMTANKSRVRQIMSNLKVGFFSYKRGLNEIREISKDIMKKHFGEEYVKAYESSHFELPNSQNDTDFHE